MENEYKPRTRVTGRRLLGLLVLVVGVMMLAGQMRFAPRVVHEVVRVERPAPPVPPEPAEMPAMPEPPAMPEIPAPPEPPDVLDVQTIEVTVPPRAPWRVFALGRVLASGLLAVAIMIMGAILIIRQINGAPPSATTSGPEADRAAGV